MDEIKRRYNYLKEEIGMLYEVYQQKCGLPETTDPQEQIRILDERKIVCLKSQVENLRESPDTVKIRIYWILDEMS